MRRPSSPDRLERATIDSSREPSNQLPEATTQRVSNTMVALSNPSRLQILVCLRSGPRTVSEIVDAVGLAQSAVSHQLRVLRDHCVVTMRRIGRTRQYALYDEHIDALIDNALEHTRALQQPTQHEVDQTPTSGPESAAS